MDRFDRIYALHGILANARRPVSRRVLQERLGCSRATLNRIIEDLRDFLGAPLEYDRRANGYHYSKTGDHPYQLPGLWFNASELHSLLATHQLLTDVQPGLLDAHLAPLRKRIEEILVTQRLGSSEIPRRVRLLRVNARRTTNDCFQFVAGALTQRKRLRVQHYNRERNESTERDVSPQRLVHYRDNWYLDAWCHLRNDLRTFALDSIQHAHPLDQPAHDIPDDALDAHYTHTYGIFAGPPQDTAVLRFTPERARWVAAELWHPEQEGRYLDNGRYELRVPYGDPRELIMDILKYGPDVEVVGPESLRAEVKERLAKAMGVYARRKKHSRVSL